MAVSCTHFMLTVILNGGLNEEVSESQLGPGSLKEVEWSTGVFFLRPYLVRGKARAPSYLYHKRSKYSNRTVTLVQQSVRPLFGRIRPSQVDSQFIVPARMCF